MARFTCILLFQLVTFISYSQEATILDARHYSNVFGETRNFRVFLPPGYQTDSSQRYPVIYFFHGWGQRYFGEGSDEYAGYDKGDQNNGDNIANYVARHKVIVVKADGYNRRNNEEYYRRPYNVLPVETYRQFPIYFPELVSHIDERFRTKADRRHRAISGLSMGGFMTFFIAAKYPHLVSSAGSFCGSPEFTIGPIDFPVEYRHMDMYKNFAGVNVRLHYGDKDFIRSYHEDMNRVWPHVMNNYSWKVYDAGHSTCGLGEMFDSIMNTFRHPLPVPARWDHTEVYPAFSVWDYKVSSDRTLPGFTVMENVDKRGFRTSVREFVPGGQFTPQVNLVITTAGIYGRNQTYVINDIDVRAKTRKQYELKSDDKGRLTIELNGSLHEIGINKKSDLPELTITAQSLQGAGWVTAKKNNHIQLEILNKGMSTATKVTATLLPFRSNVKITKGTVAFGKVGTNEFKIANETLSFIPETDTIDVVKLKVVLKDGSSRQWTQYIDVPVKPAVKELEGFEIADGRMVTVVSSGIELDTLQLGKGNGDGAANPGESIVVLAKDSGKLWRTDLEYGNTFLDPHGIVNRRSDWWSDMDHVGASAKYDEVLIASDYPVNKPAEMFAEYWLPQYPMHLLKQGVVKLTISGKDATAPSIENIQFRGDNTVECRVTDGGKVGSVKATFTSQQSPAKVIDVVLNDDGKNGDVTKGDHIYSAQIPDQKFAIYKIVIEATDEFGNREVKEAEGFVGH